MPVEYIKSRLILYLGLPGSEVSCAHGVGSVRERKDIPYAPAEEGQLDPASAKPCWEPTFSCDAHSYINDVVVC